MNSVKKLVSEEDDRYKLSSNQSALIQEVIEHANRANKLTKQMHDYHNDYELINNYLRDNDNTCPFVITGLSGAGKSSFMAFVAKKVKFLMITKNSKI